MSRQAEVEKILALLKENCGECAEEAGWCLYFVSGILVDNGIRSKDGFRAYGIRLDTDEWDVAKGIEVRPEEYKENDNEEVD